jgi:membrane dipeptidase
MAIYREAIVIDTHNDMPTRVLDEGFDPGVRHDANDGHTDLPRLAESRITAQFMAAWVDAPYALRTPDASFERAVRYMDSIRELVDRHPEQLLFATTGADVRRAKREGKVAIFIGVEGGHAIEESLDKLRELHARGARCLTLTWNNGNQWAGSSIGSFGTRTGGLTPFGREVIREMNRLGMLVDISHASDETLADVIDVTTAPVIASHSGARAIADHPRNLTDDQLRAIARGGGVVQVNFFPRFLETRFRIAMDEAEARLDAEVAAERARGREVTRAEVDARLRALIAAIPPTPLSVLIDHIEHVVRVAGIDHVGLGSDFDGISAVPEGLEDVTAFPRIAQALLERGYGEEAIRKILGGNTLRLLEEVLDRTEFAPHLA